MSSPTTTTTTITTHPVTPQDTLAIATIEAAAFESNPLGALVFGPTSQESINKRAKELGELLESDRSVRGVKAVISTTSTHTQSHQEGEGKGKEKEAEEEEIIGWALWKYYLDDPETRKEKELVPPEGCPCPELFYESFGRFREIKVEIMRGRRYILLSTLAVHPNHQNKGIGSLLVRTGLEQISSSHPSLPVCLNATERGYPVYRKFGFRDVAEVVVDLSKYGVEGVVIRNVEMVRESEAQA